MICFSDEWLAQKKKNQNGLTRMDDHGKKMRWFLLLPLCLFVSAYRPIVILPGFGGSVLLGADGSRVWPPSPPSFLGTDWQDRLVIGRPVHVYPPGDARGTALTTPLTRKILGTGFYEDLMDALAERREVRPVSYDFRLIGEAGYTARFFSGLEAYLESLGRSDVFCHSLGGLVFHHFMVSRVSEEWKRRHIDRVVFLNVPFGGSVSILGHVLNGFAMEIPTLRLRIPIHGLHTFPGFQWCLPNRYGSGDVLLVSEKESYSVYNMSMLFREEDRRVYERDIVPRLWTIEESPGVNTFHLVCSGTETVRRLDPIGGNVYGDGDGLVPSESLMIPNRWRDDNSHVFVRLDGKHSEILSDPILIRMLLEMS
ncbi:hypothetical protein EBZ80_05325 [bacterium]|nr:hypothetical protein [bacterium]